MKFAFVSLGCAKALVDTEVMMGIVEEAGHQITARAEEADFVVINTCCFIDEARKETEQTIEEFLRKGKRVIAAGCYVSRFRDRLSQLFPQLYSMLDTEQITEILKAAEGKQLPPSEKLYLMDSRTPRRLTTPRSWTYLKISEGCSHSCAFCIIPAIRGPYRSRPLQDVVEEAVRLEEGGVLEINLISQDSSYYYRDRGRKALPELLEALIKATRKAWIRVLYLYPEEVDDALLDAFTAERVLPYFDIPFQHSHPKVIKAMGRGMDGNRSLRLLEKIRKRIPEAIVRTSLIVGFPVEGKEEFEHLLAWLEQARIDRLGVFRYSREEGTQAWALGDPVPEEEKKRRIEEVVQLQAEISSEKLASRVGKKYKVLIEGTLADAPDYYFARSFEFAPEVDGGIYVRKTREVDPADFAEAVITHSYTYDLEGELI